MNKCLVPIPFPFKTYYQNISKVEFLIITHKIYYFIIIAIIIDYIQDKNKQFVLFFNLFIYHTTLTNVFKSTVVIVNLIVYLNLLNYV